MATQKKIEKVKDLQDKVSLSNGIILAEYRGLSVPELSELREKILAHSTFEIVKNTLLNIAVKDTVSEEFSKHLSGPNAVAFVKGDPYLTLKELKSFAKQSDKLSLKYGVIEGKEVDAGELLELADLESREVLFAKIAGMLKAPASKSLAVVAASAQNIDSVVKALEEKLENTSN
jgi:large subunit ribosomal protein L10